MNAPEAVAPGEEGGPVSPSEVEPPPPEPPLDTDIEEAEMEEVEEEEDDPVEPGKKVKVKRKKGEEPTMTLLADPLSRFQRRRDAASFGWNRAVKIFEGNDMPALETAINNFIVTLKNTQPFVAVLGVSMVPQMGRTRV